MRQFWTTFVFIQRCNACLVKWEYSDELATLRSTASGFIISPTLLTVPTKSEVLSVKFVTSSPKFNSLFSLSIKLIYALGCTLYLTQDLDLIHSCLIAIVTMFRKLICKRLSNSPSLLRIPDLLDCHLDGQKDVTCRTSHANESFCAS